MMKWLTRFGGGSFRLRRAPRNFEPTRASGGRPMLCGNVRDISALRSGPDEVDGLVAALNGCRAGPA